MATECFFYGTLQVPEILSRVLGRNVDGFSFERALLRDHALFRVKGQDYPAVVHVREAGKVDGFNLKSQNSDVDQGVPGVVVTGDFTDADLYILDEFEGDEYKVSHSSISYLENPSKNDSQARFYEYIGPLENLVTEAWTLSDFMQTASHRWIGVDTEYIDTDQKRKALEYRCSTGERFGKELREKYWNFEKDWVNLNHGSYGSAPKPVVDSFLAIREKIDKAPDRFMRLEYESQLVTLRSRLAELVDCDTDDLVMVPCATMGVNVALQAMSNEWQKGDRLLYFHSSIYYACKTSLQHIVDTHRHLDLSLLPIELTYPVSHAEVLAKTRQAIEDSEKEGVKVRLALVDGISSNPGVIVPWEELVEVFKEKDVVSLVDAAHNIGQLPVSLRTTQPDFWVSNCHKWLLAHRGCAVLHVNKRLQHLVHSIPISHYYSVRTPENASKWVEEFVWTGTLDWSPIFSTLDALDFRRDVLGGEERITSYCHDLAIKGGERVAEILGTRTMKNENPEEGELVANMVNVLVPLPSHTPFGSGPPLEGDKLKAFWYKTLAHKYKTVVPIFPHGGLPWVRLSAQVYLDLDDFEFVGQAVKSVCEAIERGEHLQEVETDLTKAEGDE
ncbi:uncharacterized protein JCM6883_001300 [Sporobolomyces salmoneus]|uniref:uncharacterized protein n=1 Tax=Sporobolomyces salmoneus TaxID=183962 RepID=UPI00317E4746